MAPKPDSLSDVNTAEAVFLAEGVHPESARVRWFSANEGLSRSYVVEISVEILGLDVVTQNYLDLTRALPLATVYYALKAHPAPEILRVLTELGEVRQHVNVFVDGESIRDLGGLATPVGGNAEIFILPALSGG